jgi:cell division protein FtsW (lipid II flippase)
LKPDADPLGAASRRIQSLIAVGAGGLRQRVGEEPAEALFLPYPHTDFIFAIVGEELGFIGAVGVIACFGVIAWRGLGRKRAPEPFAAFLGRGDRHDRRAGGDQHVGRAGVDADEGIPLPFVSYGGSSLVASWIAGGLILKCFAA